MNKIFLILLMIFWQTSIQAQEATVRECGTTEYMNALEHAHPEVAQQRQLIEQHTQQFIQSNHKKSRSIITIPVVVHVVYNLAVQNISDAQIQSQIAVLNKDFRKLNTDFLNTPGSFQPLAADCQIEFVLAKRDPNGDSTTGITRTATLTTSFTNNNNVKSSATGGKDAWPATAYLNIWVCKLSGGLIGYGQFPGGPAATDGVVISYKAFGTMGAALPPFNKGRTATHEIGHWLNLYHIWGDDAGSCNGTDVVEDTPNQGNSNTGVPVYPKISCNNAPFGDMFMNYMDYTDDIAMTMFSVGQKARMDAMFVPGGAKFPLLSSQGGMYPAPPVVCGVPTNLSVQDITINSATLQWDNTPDATEYTVEYKMQQDASWNTLSSMVHTLPLNNLSNNTAYEFRVQASCPIGTSAFSNAFSFSTLPIPVVACDNNFEPNNFMTSAQSITNDKDLRSMIGNAADNDYYTINIPASKRNIKVSLSDLPQDYDLYLYAANTSVLKVSQAGGLGNEEIVYNPAQNVDATYYVRVRGYNGAYSDINCYTLHVETSASPLRESAEPMTDSKPEFVLFPMPAVDYFTTNVFYEGVKDLVCNVYNAMGQKLYSKKMLTQDGANEIRIETQSMNSGMYLLEVIDSEERRVQKFTVEK